MSIKKELNKNHPIHRKRRERKTPLLWDKIHSWWCGFVIACHFQEHPIRMHRIWIIIMVISVISSDLINKRETYTLYCAIFQRIQSKNDMLGLSQYHLMTFSANKAGKKRVQNRWALDFKVLRRFQVRMCSMKKLLRVILKVHTRQSLTEWKYR
jgi:hypothetical protein